MFSCSRKVNLVAAMVSDALGGRDCVVVERADPGGFDGKYRVSTEVVDFNQQQVRLTLDTENLQFGRWEVVFQLPSVAESMLVRGGE